ncbi:BTAD domain-containing putative transcriptional regulator [Streptomyces turgidiscabies]|uniref:Transcriptional regulatory protein, C-terminal domain protein n=1 Tax=Streptomyces turgidiscabies (strain Car8) TaxID=698760 RepID=L7F1N7_STRT8|nr:MULTISPECIES: BTAD domain-containing putative transcriptional regulator [Streptomyces]ELP65553.1 transcriptional regulatory protein, C-terminal domain protein [Streptomyces turgidiscabies Car8]MDX3497588.1 BTAD domain-containing putative transcriptional regulator [Streptomyces turgidiscabies]
MEFRVLGPVEVWCQGRMLPPLPRKPTALLTAGLVDAGRLVSVDRLVDAIWGNDPPSSAAKLVQGYVVRLRRALRRSGGPETIVTRPRGYQFQAEEGQLDLRRFLALVERGRAATALGERRAAVEAFESALGLWRGPALGSPTSPALQAEADRLEEVRLATSEHALESRLTLGGGAEIVGELTRLVAEQPLRERPRALLMRALDRCGRRADALRVYRDGDWRLRTELGIEPGRELREVHARLLADCGSPVLGGEQRHERRARQALRRKADAQAGQSQESEAEARTGRAQQRKAAAQASPEAVPEAPRAARPALAPSLPSSPFPPRPPAQLPCSPEHLTGRSAETARLEALLRGGGERTRVCVVHGMPGVGKTALVLHVAHRLASMFPDGQLYADLGGGDPARAADPSDVLAGFLRALGPGAGPLPAQPYSHRAGCTPKGEPGYTAGYLPGSLSERAAAFRTLAADRRMLVVLDDAADEGQVRSLLPGAGRGSVVLISGRRALPGLAEAERLGLDVLGPDQTAALLGRLAGPGRTGAEPEAAAALARLSGGLPLAVRAVASRLGARSQWPLRVLADRLADEDARLDELACGDLDVRAGIESCYRSLPEPQRQVFRRLGMLESPDFAPWVAAPLVAASVPEAQRLVDRLADAHLLESGKVDSSGQVRYRFHDLVRLYALECADHEETPEEQLAALSRLVRAWLTLIRRLDAGAPVEHARHTPGAAANGPDAAFTARLPNAPYAWLRAESATLSAVVALAARLGLHQQAYELEFAHARVASRVRGTEAAPWTAGRARPTLEGHL